MWVSVATRNRSPTADADADADADAGQPKEFFAAGKVVKLKMCGANASFSLFISLLPVAYCTFLL